MIHHIDRSRERSHFQISIDAKKASAHRLSQQKEVTLLFHLKTIIPVLMSWYILTRQRFNVKQYHIQMRLKTLFRGDVHTFYPNT